MKIAGLKKRFRRATYMEPRDMPAELGMEDFVTKKHGPFAVPAHLGWLKLVPDVYPVELAGDCMEPTLRGGWIGFVDPNTPPAPGDIAVIFLGEHKKGVAKRFLGYADDGRIHVALENPLAHGYYPPGCLMHRLIAWFDPAQIKAKPVEEAA